MRIWIFLLCTALVIFIQFTLYQPVIQYRLFDVQDWRYLHIYRSFQFLYPDLFSQLINSWSSIGLHETSQIYYIGLLSELFKFNYQSYQIANIFLKTLATLSFFPLILLIFKNKLLAFLATLLFGINSATAGSLLIVALGEEFLAIAFLNIFLITYYKKLYFLSSLLFLLTFLIAPPRMFPLLVLIPLIEIYWLIKNFKLKNLKISSIRILLHLFPVLLVSLSAPISSPDFQFTNSPFKLLQDIINGNWHNLLDPFAGIGWTLFTNDFWKFFGRIELETLKNFREYFTFLFLGPLWIFGISTLFLSLILSKKPKRFFLMAFSLNFIAEILMFFIANDNYRIFESILKTDDLGQFVIVRDPNVLALDAPNHFMSTKYPAILGIYILIVAFVAFWEWRKNKENILLQAVWVGPIFAVIFHFPAWAVQGFLINDYTSIHRYFLVPAMGTSLFLAAILTMFFKRRWRWRPAALPLIFVIILTLFKTNQSAIKEEYLGLNPERIKITDQQMLHDKFIDKFGDSLVQDDILFYFDLSSQYYKEALVVSDIGHWISLRKENLLFSCTGTFTDLEALKDSMKMASGQIDFVFPGQCDSKDKKLGIRRSNELHLYSLENLRAFRVVSGDFTDISSLVSKNLIQSLNK